MKKITFNILVIVISFLFLVNTAIAQIRIVTIGDSTMANYDEEKNSGENEMRGWAQMLPVFLKSGVEIDNRARNGRSSKSFYYEFWKDIRETIRPGDYVFIQFGHNDEKNKGQDSETRGVKGLGTAAWGQYQDYLADYVKESRERGAIPVLLTSVVRGGMDENGKLLPQSLHNLSHICGNDSVMNYPLAMQALAEKLDVPLVDMTDLTRKVIEEYGYEKAKKYIYCRKDDTHLKATGGLLFARLAVEDLIRQGILAEAFLY